MDVEPSPGIGHRLALMKVASTRIFGAMTSGGDAPGWNATISAIGTLKTSLHWKNILVPTDISEPSKKAIEIAVALAQEHKADIILLHIVPLPDCCSFGTPPDTDEMLAFARECLDEIARTFPSGLNCKKIVRLGTRETAQQIIEEACNIPADLIVVGTHGCGGLKRALLGGTAERVIRHSPCPVLVARSAELDSRQTFLRAEAHDNPFKKGENNL